MHDHVRLLYFRLAHPKPSTSGQPKARLITISLSLISVLPERVLPDMVLPNAQYGIMAGADDDDLHKDGPHPSRVLDIFSVVLHGLPVLLYISSQFIILF